MNKIYLLLITFALFSCSNPDDTIVIEEEDPGEIEEPKVYKLKKETFNFEDFFMTEREVKYEYDTNGFVSKITDDAIFITGNVHESTTDYYYTSNRLDSLVNIYVQPENTSKTSTVFKHDSNGFIVSSYRYFNEKLVKITNYFYKTNNQLDFTVSTRIDSDGKHQNPVTTHLIYENGVLVGYESAFPTTRTFDDKNNPQINLYSPDYKRIAENLFIHNTLTQSSTNSHIMRKYEYEYNSDDFPIKSFHYENDEFVFETNYIYY